ncbi:MULTISPECIES: ATP-grasp domain-containing protein [Streptacidiphilus]|uniref:ATP-grasp domain-containing protein n=1 Tax=Streptacidiphilus cavernicola TaxID=3342716 RepID=A0ABV6UXA9_9ACTN|nr:ATP-grasp domain-containing protein [Streptacidiphilus jeojiense]
MNESSAGIGSGHGGALAFVESNLTGTGMQALRLARDLGLRILFLTSDLERYSVDPDTARTIGEIADEILICDTQSPEAIEKVLLDSVVPVRGVMTVMEYYVPTTAAAARRLGLPGIDPLAAGIARDKLKTRVRCAERGVPVPGFRFVRDAAEVDAALAEFGLPCVVKPVDESASIGVALCRTRQDAVERIAAMAASTTNSKGQPRVPGGLVEECLFGHEVSVETFTFDGSTTVLGVTDKLLGPTPHFVELGHTFPSTLGEGARAAAELAVAALDAIGFDFGPAHVEVKLTAQGPVLIEINARTGGDFIPDLVHHAIGVPLLERSIVAHSGGRPDLTPTRAGGAAIRFLAGRSGTVDSVPDTRVLDRFPALVAFQLKAAPGRETRWPLNSHDRLGHVMTSADTPQEAAVVADAALSHLAVTYRES